MCSSWSGSFVQQALGAGGVPERQLEEAVHPAVEDEEEPALRLGRERGATLGGRSRLVDAADVGGGKRDDERAGRARPPAQLALDQIRLVRMRARTHELSGAALELREMDEDRHAVELVAQLSRGDEARLEQVT